MSNTQRTRGPVLLRSWLADQGYSQAQAAELFGCHESMVSHLLAGRFEPGRQLANRINAFSDGAVPQSSWDELALPDGSADAAA